MTTKTFLPKPVIVPFATVRIGHYFKYGDKVWKKIRVDQAITLTNHMSGRFEPSERVEPLNFASNPTATALLSSTSPFVGRPV